ncbi:sensor histidine kinase [Micromonospora saelicesensis]|uniref:sensor histidine kinase n=1 Tax=Micromonospora saelicesensis TaxID=285676 RepID=UPI000DC482C0|nr:sensor histidine kinase [Micromonospora saelicesensis]RAO50899.1 Histidine kinase [Micromonospora saelicesensis]
MIAQNVWQALGRPGFLCSGWLLRSVGYLTVSGLTGLLTLVVALLLLSVGGLLAVVVVGIPLLGAIALLGLPVAGIERWSLRMIDARPVPDAHRTPPRPGPASWLRTRFTEPVTWRELGYAALLMLVLWPIDLLAVILGLTVPLALLATPLLLATVGEGQQVNVLKAYPVTSWPAAFATCAAGLVALVACAYGLGLLAGSRGALARFLIASPVSPLGDRITELTRSRLRLVDAFEAERGRIERDLHDGAQQRLVALTMMLGMARLDAPAGPLAEQLTRAHDEAERALVELRELIRGIHPPVLTDYGLDAALVDLAARSAIPVDVHLALPQRFSQPIESTVYFVVSEVLSNMAKHSGADHGEIFGGYSHGRLVVTICDNGRGGADVGAGTGLLGLGDRVSVVDGRLSLSSPLGGPTQIVVEISCQPLPDSE